MWQTCRFWLARSQLPQQEQIQAFPCSPDRGRGLGVDEVSGEAGSALGKALQDTQCIGMELSQPRAQEQGQGWAGMGRDPSHAGVGSHLSHPSALRVLPRCFHCSLRSSQEPARALAKPRQDHSSPAVKIPRVWLGWAAGGTFPPLSGKGLRELMASSGFIPAHFCTAFLCWIPHPAFCLALTFHKRLECLS